MERILQHIVIVRAVLSTINVICVDLIFEEMGNTIFQKTASNHDSGKALTIYHFSGIFYVTVNGLCDKKFTIFIRNNFTTCLFTTAYICNRLYYTQRKRLLTLFNHFDKDTIRGKEKRKLLEYYSHLRRTQNKRGSHYTNNKTDQFYTDMNIQLVVKKSKDSHIFDQEIYDNIAVIEEKSNSNLLTQVKWTVGIDWYSKMSTCFVYPVSRSLGETFNSLMRGVTTEYYDDEVMSNYFQRLASFKNYVFENVPSSVRLAEAGWYFTGRYKETKCFFCKTVFSSWTHADDPLAMHKELQPKCGFIIEQDLQNKKSKTESKVCVSCDDEHTTNACSCTCSFTNNSSHNPSQNEEKVFENTADEYLESSRNDDTTKFEEMLPSSQIPVRGEIQNEKMEITRPEQIEHMRKDNSNPEASLDRRSHITIPERYENLRPEVNMLQYQHQDMDHQRSNGALSYSFHNDEITRNFSHLSIGNGTRESLLSVDNVPSTIQVQSHGDSQHQQLVPTHERQSHEIPIQQSRLKNRKFKTQFLEMKHPNFQALPVRMSSFMSWPLHSKLSPRAMALAGFFYKGYSDVVECFWCGIAIVDWEEGDDPCIEHVRWQPFCPYMIQTKGEAFSLLVQKDTTRANNRRDIEAKNVAEKEILPVTSDIVTSQYDKLTIMGFSQSDIERAIRRLIGTGNRHPGFEDILNSLLQAGQTSEPNQTRPTSLMQDNQPSGFSEQAIYRENENSFGNKEERKQDFSVEPSNNDDRLLCKICLDKQVGVTFAPCGHLTSCMECSQNLTHCPVCRKVIQQKIKCFIT